MPLITYGEIVPEFIGGLNVAQINKCELECENQTHENKNNITDEWSVLSCFNFYLPKSESCKQFRKLYELSGSAYDFKQYGAITLFKDGRPTNGPGTRYLMVDKRGNMINFHDNEVSGLTTDKNYKNLIKQHLHIELSNPDVMVSPSYRILLDKNIQLIFKQELFNGPCRGCSKIGVAEIAYEFNKYGEFVKGKLIKLIILHQDKLVHDICCN